MAHRRQFNGEDFLGLGLTAIEAAFVIEYIKDLNKRRAAKACGMDPDLATAVLGRERVQKALDHIFKQRLELAHIDLDWLLMELVDNHYLARQSDKFSASNAALNLIGKHVRVDAFTAEKIQLDISQDTVDRLTRGRQRVAKDKQTTPLDDLDFY